MTHRTATARRPEPARRGVAAAALLVLAGLTAACADQRAADPTTTAPRTPTTPPGTAPVEPSVEDPPPVEWVVQVGSSADDSLGGLGSRDDEVVAGGFTDGDLGGSPAGDRDVLVVVVGTDAEVRSLDTAGGPGDDSASGVATGDGTVVACGDTQGALGGPGPGGIDGWCAPVDPGGGLGEASRQGGTDEDRLQGASLSGDGAVGHAAGHTLGLVPGASDTTGGLIGGGDAVLWQVGPDGAPRWIRQFGTEQSDSGRAVATTDDGDGLITGYTLGDLDGPSRGGSDGFVARYDRDGLPRWVRQFGSSGNERPAAVAVGGDPARGTETYLVAGSTDGALAPALGGGRTDPLDGPRLDGAEPAPSNAGGTDAVVVALDPSGAQTWTVQIGSEAADAAAAVTVDGNTVLVAGTTAGTVSTADQPAAGGRDGFLAALELDTGRLRWITQFGSPADEVVRGITTTEDGLVVVSGQTTGALGDEPNAGGNDGFLVAYPLPDSGGSAASVL